MTAPRSTWDERWLSLARLVAQWSKDRSRKVGAVIVDRRNVLVALGWNGFPRGVADGHDARHDRPAKYKWTEHAERNAIYNAAAAGHPTLGCRMYVPWFPCADCARAIVQAGLSELICEPPDFSDERWAADFRVADDMLREAGVVLFFPPGQS